MFRALSAPLLRSRSLHLALLAALVAGCGDGAARRSTSEGTAAGTTSSEETSNGGTSDPDGPSPTGTNPSSETEGMDTGSTGVPGEPWEPDGDGGQCAVDTLQPVHVYVRRVKNLLTGQPPTSEEIERVVADADVLRDLIAEWIETEDFDAKMIPFFRLTLQQPVIAFGRYTSQATNNDGTLWDPANVLKRNVGEMMSRTALMIIKEGRPFSEIASTRRFMMTTGAMAWLLKLDRGDWPAPRFYDAAATVGGIQFNASTPLSVQIENGVFHSAQDVDSCTGPEGTSDGPVFYPWDSIGSSSVLEGLGHITCRPRPVVFNEGDFADWRPVTVQSVGPTGDTLRYWDAPGLRASDNLALRIPRTGFFSTPPFLGHWRTNEDNSFRVVMNQTLIVGLGVAFEDTDATTPLGDEGLAAEHAAPGTQCYGCHKNLDPMRNFFDNEFYPDTTAPRLSEDRPDQEASFSFQGHTAEGDDLEDLGRIIAEHPIFAAAWTRKMCAFATSAPCDESSEEFQRVVTAFEDSNLDFKTLLVELFSSPLVTGARCGGGVEASTMPTSIARAQHFCAALTARTGLEPVCADENRTDLDGIVGDLAAALPAETWSRGGDSANLPTSSSMFFAASAASICQEVAEEVVGGDGALVNHNDVEGSVDYLVRTLMGVAPADPRHDWARALVVEHLTAAQSVSADSRARMQSAFVLACTSPFVTSMDL